MPAFQNGYAVAASRGITISFLLERVASPISLYIMALSEPALQCLDPHHLRRDFVQDRTA
jgi:hypothetical protein